MPITITVPADTKTPGTAGHTSDHNVIADALTALGAAAVNGTSAGDFVTLAAGTPGTPAAGTSVLYSGSAGAATAKLDSGYAGAIALGSPGDHSSHTVTTATAPAQAITALWTIPANDAAVGTVYRLTFAALPTWGSTQQALNLQFFVDAANISAGGGSGQVAATAFAASAALWLRGTADLMIISTGAGGTCTMTIEYTVCARAAALPGTAAQNTVTVVDLNSTSGGTTAFDTTASHTISVNAVWASVTGAPTITGTQSYLERLGA